MSLSGQFTRNILVPTLESILGRRNLVRLARVLTMESRLDSGNEISENGELMVQQVMLRNLAEGKQSIVFDVGANAGEWTNRLLDHPDSAAIVVHAFEPASATFITLTQNLARYGSRVVLQNQALSTQVGMASFFVVGAGLGTNSLHRGTTPAESIESVRLNTVDGYCMDANISRIDLLKIDAEGHDLLVLQGARAMFQSHAISLIQFEYNQRWVYSRNFLKDAFDLLQPLGYSLGKITRKGIEFYPEWHFELESFREGNYLACLPEYRDRFLQVKWWNLP